MPARRCPKCGAKELYVINTEPKPCGLQQIGVKSKVIRRRLECENCWERFTTYEIAAEDLTRIRDTLHTIKKKARLSMTVMGRLETAIKNCKKDMARVAETNKPMDARYIDDNKP